MALAASDFLQNILEQALVENASDIHLEPFENSFRIRLRTPTGLQTLPMADAKLFAPLVRHIKLLARLDIAIEFFPQDGKFSFNLNGASVEYRLSTLPTQYGESLVLRVLDRSRIPLEIPSLGLPPAATNALRAALTHPSGLIVVAGPTGSGKTTTLYACVRALSPQRTLKIVSVEDPIEYALAGVQQVAVSRELPTAEALRALLRHDPDVIFVGEIRDAATAQLAIHAALTGHLVLTSVHAPDAATVAHRLIDFGIHPTLLSCALKFILAQRLLCVDHTRYPIAEHLCLTPQTTQAIINKTSLQGFIQNPLPALETHLTA